jgi:TorA maturation chaperone TorD
MTETPSESFIDEVDLARAREYSLLSTLLLRCPDAALIDRLTDLRGDSSPLGLAHTALGQAAARVGAEGVAREYFNLFVGVGRGELLPYASYYQTGSLHARPLARLRQTLRRIGIERADGLKEPEDHAGILFEIMGGLSSGAIASPAGTDREIFESYLAPWIERFFADLEQAKAADFYARVGVLGRIFIAIEIEAFAIPD